MTTKKYKGKQVKMWYNDYKKNCADCRHLKRLGGQDFWVIIDEVWNTGVPLEHRPVIVYCGLTDEKCAKVPEWEDG